MPPIRSPSLTYLTYLKGGLALSRFCHRHSLNDILLGGKVALR